jgi:hypothetical protein
MGRRFGIFDEGRKLEVGREEGTKLLLGLSWVDKVATGL